jgi:hypothetical protein
VSVNGGLETALRRVDEEVKPEEQGVVDRVKFNRDMRTRPSGHVVHEIESADAHCSKDGYFRAWAANTAMPGTILQSPSGGQITIFCKTCCGQGAFDASGKPL